MAIDEDYIEAILAWGERGPSPAVEHWLAERGLRCLSMRAGLLITGGQHDFEAAFNTSLQNVEPPADLPVPAEFRGIVSAITIPKPRHIMGIGR